MSDKQHTATSIGRSASWSIANQSAGQILVLLVFLVTARYVDKESFGVMATALIIVEFFKQVFLESLGTTFYARKKPTDEDYNAGFFIIFSGGILSAACIYLMAEPASMLLDIALLEKTLHWIAVLLIVTGLFKMHEIWLIKNQQFKPLAIRSIVSITIGGVVGIAMAVNGYGIEALVAQQLITAIITTIWLWYVCPWKPGIKVDGSEFKGILKYAGQVSLGKLAGFANGQSDVFFSAYYLGAAATGVYNAAKRLVSAVMMIIGGGISNVVFPTLADLSNDNEQLKKAYLKSVTIVSFFTAPIFAGISAISDHLIYIILGEKWMEAAPVFAILVIASFLSPVNNINSNIICIKNKPSWLTAITAFSGAIMLVILLTITKYGLIPLVIAIAIARFTLFPISLFVTLNLMNSTFKEFFFAVYKQLVAAIIMYGMVFLVDYYWQPSAIFGIVFLIPVGVLSYFSIMFILNKKLLIELKSYVKSN